MDASFLAPLRPIMPSTSPCFTSKLTSFKAQNSSRVERALSEVRGQISSAVAAKQVFRLVGQHVAQRCITFVRLLPQTVTFPEIFYRYDRIGHLEKNWQQALMLVLPSRFFVNFLDLIHARIVIPTIEKQNIAAPHGGNQGVVVLGFVAIRRH
jgi:hypothetical protein